MYIYIYIYVYMNDLLRNVGAGDSVAPQQTDQTCMQLLQVQILKSQLNTRYTT